MIDLIAAAAAAIGFWFMASVAVGFVMATGRDVASRRRRGASGKPGRVGMAVEPLHQAKPNAFPAIQPNLEYVVFIVMGDGLMDGEIYACVEAGAPYAHLIGSDGLDLHFVRTEEAIPYRDGVAVVYRQTTEG